MKPLLTLTPREEALERLNAALLPVTVEKESLNAQEALGRSWPKISLRRIPYRTLPVR
jgi:hypothetical protein